MAFNKIDAVYLYADIKYVQKSVTVTLPNGETKDVLQPAMDETSDSFKAKQYLDSLNIKYELLNYADEAQHAYVFPPLNSWIFEDGQHTFNTFPFVIYTKCDDAIQFDQWPKAVVIGLDAIQNANLANLYAMGR